MFNDYAIGVNPNVRPSFLTCKIYRDNFSTDYRTITAFTILWVVILVVHPMGMYLSQSQRAIFPPQTF